MNSRPGPGIRESLQNRESSRPQRAPGPQPSHRLAQSTPRSHLAQYLENIDPSLDDRQRSTDDANATRGVANTKAHGAAIGDPVHSTAQNAARPVQKGKPYVFFTNDINTAMETRPSSPQAQPADSAVDLPLPPRSGHARVLDIPSQNRPSSDGTGYARSSRADTSHPELLFPGGKTADLFPWTGNHPEDALSETLVKLGVSNKPQIMNETTAARLSLWPNLKSRPGLSNLSSLFLAVLEKRQSCGRVTQPSSFKPPPRLTLRDSTRETWLHDLANPAVGLRRLSRTIPHGITGTVLLDHCLNKNIPLPRAIWLAKCVGINEMRSHKRKGQAGTLTWARGWTSSVEQFLDIVLSTIGRPGWKARVTYALQLATSLYKEQLLEEEHFLDWVLKNLESCPPERMFLWFMIVSLYSQDLTASRRRGRRLADLLLSYVAKLYASSDENNESPLLRYLEQLLLKVLVTSPSCLLLPDRWNAHLPVLQRLALKHPDSKVLLVVQDLNRRARRLCPSSPSDRSAQSPARRIVLLLDAVDYTPDVNVELIAKQCWDALPNARDLVSIVLRWASSSHRVGMQRIYLVTRLLCKWWRSGIDTDDAILAFFQSVDCGRVDEPCNIYRIVAELVRSKTFSVGRFLQWLIATGSFDRNSDFTSTSFNPSRLIVEIPLSGVPEHVRNLRSTLLRGTPHSTESEEVHLDQAESAIRSHLSGLFGTGRWNDNPPGLDMTNLSPTIRLELALLLRYQVASNVRVTEQAPTTNTFINGDTPVSTITLRDFHLVRSYLEDFGQLSILADVLGIVITSLDFDVLSAVADTLHYHHLTFKAMGAFSALFDSMMLRYSMLRSFRIPERDFLLSLTSLCHVAQADARIRQILASDLARLEQRNAIAACSPVSDTTVEAIQNAAADSDEEIDRILSNSSTLDRAAMTGMLEKIMANLSDQVVKHSLQSCQHASWLYRLRSLNETTFSTALTEWLKVMLSGDGKQLSIIAVTPLVTSGCLSLVQLLTVARNCFDEHKVLDPAMAQRIAFTLFHLILPADELSQFCPSQEAYRFRLEQRDFCLAQHPEVLQFLGETLHVVQASPTPDGEAELRRLLSSVQVRNLMKQYILKDVQGVSRAFGIGSASSADSIIGSSVKNMLDSLLDPCGRLDLAQKSIVQQMETICEAADELCLCFCQLEIQCLFFMASGSPDCSLEALSSTFSKAIISAAEHKSASLDLVSGLETDLAVKIREYAEREVLGATSFLATPSTADLGDIPKEEEARIGRYLAIIRATSSNVTREEQSTAVGPLANRLKGLAEQMDKHSDQDLKVMSLTDWPSWCVAVSQWLNVLLDLVVAQRSMLLHKASSQHQAALLWSLRRVFTHPALAHLPSLSEYAFDAALLIHDAVADDVRQHLTKLNLSKPNPDCRCVFLFESTPPKDGWLALSRLTSEPGTVQNTATASPSTPTPLPNQNQSQTQNPLPFENFMHLRSPAPGGLQPRPQHPQPALRGYPQYPQHPAQGKTGAPQHLSTPAAGTMNMKMNVSSVHHQGQMTQMQRLQQMQGLGMQRNLPGSLGGVRGSLGGGGAPGAAGVAGSGLVTAGAGKLGTAPLHGKVDGAGAGAGAGAGSGEMGMGMGMLLPFQLSPWEILPEGGGGGGGGGANVNETAVSLGLFAGRRV